jgi:hypothetical protein
VCISAITLGVKEEGGWEVILRWDPGEVKEDYIEDVAEVEGAEISW